MDTIFQDVRYGVRMLLKSPGFTMLAVLTLALGIGANTAIFSVVDAVLLRPLPFPEPNRLISIRAVNPQRARTTTISTPDIEEWQRDSRTVEQFGVWRDWSFTLSDNGQTEGLGAGIASAGLFRALGVKPVLGRLFGPEDETPGRNQVVLLTYKLWQGRFGGDKNILGRPLQLDDKPFTVIGVLPADFNTPTFGWMKVWAPHTVDPDLKDGRKHRNRQVIARLRPGVSLQQARAELDTLAAQVAKQYPDTNAGFGVRVEELMEREVGGTRDSLMLFLVAVGMVLLIACVNVVNLLLTRVSARRTELAVREALGAGAMRLGRLLVTETLLLCLLGGGAGLLLGSWALDGLISLAPADTPRLDQVHLDGRAFAFTAAVSIIVGLLMGIIPAWRARKLNIEDVLKEGGFARAGATNLRAGQALASLEIALATALLIGAALLGQSFVRLQRIPADFKPDGLLMVQSFPGINRYPEKAQVVDYYQRVRDELQTIPGVQSVATGSAGPYFGGYEPAEFLPEGQSDPTSGNYPQAHFFNISPRYFETLGIPLIHGRDFNAADNASAPAVVIVNRALAQRNWPGQNPVGKRMRLGHDGPLMEVVGVVGDVREWPDAMDAQPRMYFPYAQQARWAAYFIVRSSGDPAALAATVRTRMWSVDGRAVLSKATTMKEEMALPLRDPKFRMTLTGVFAGLALALAVVGVYGIVAYATMQRTREIGIRLALGAPRGRILRLVMARGILLAMAGAVIGALGALALGRLLTGMLFGVRTTDPLTFVVIAVAQMAVALIATYIPARRATRVDPLIALRYE